MSCVDTNYIENIEPPIYPIFIERVFFSILRCGIPDFGMLDLFMLTRTEAFDAGIKYRNSIDYEFLFIRIVSSSIPMSISDIQN